MLARVRQFAGLTAYVIRAQGVSGFAVAAWRRLLGSPAPIFKGCLEFIEGRTGLEIGGPSSIFGPRGLLPAYPAIARLDNCNFSNQTRWEGEIVEGLNFTVPGCTSRGFQYIREAVDLGGIPTHRYDFVLSSHVLEHVANPIRALVEWRRVLKPGGALLVVLPHREGCFDHRRPVTPLAHLIEDHDRLVGEDDLTHLDEVLRLTDLSKTPDAGQEDEFVRRSRTNFEYRGMHHHVFDARAAVALLEYAGFQLRAVEVARPYHIILLAQTHGSGERPNSRVFMEDGAALQIRSPFSSDRSHS